MSGKTAVYRDLTEYEILALEATHNLSDGHPHFSPSPAEQSIIDRLPSIWRDAASRTQGGSDAQLLRALAEFHRQPRMLTTGREPLLAYASSISLGIVCTYLAQTGRRVSLLEPCFDNLFELLQHHRLDPVPLPEDVVFRPDQAGVELDEIVTGDTLFIVDPNNPTGSSSLLNGARRFRQIVDFCARRGKLIVLDLSFSAFLRGPGMNGRPDLYEILEDAQVSYILIEDTGKVWPTQDLKCAVTSCSADVYDAMRAIHMGVLLNVSPVTTTLAAEFIRASAQDGFRAIPRLLLSNRSYLEERIPREMMRVAPASVPVSVAWMAILDGRDANTLQSELMVAGVHILPGSHFYWSGAGAGHDYLRVALSRDELTFRASVDHLVAAL